MGLALAGALLVGLSLGVMGSGGSILTVPVLVYLIGQPEKLAIASSLVIVGSIALAGAIPYARQRLVDGRSVLMFGPPAMAGSYGGAFLSRYVNGAVQLGVFAVVVLVAGFFMLRPRTASPGGAPRAAWRIGFDGVLVGVLTGFVGVGGGFLIVPALVLLGGLAMHMAVGTSLVLIALNAFTAFTKHAALLGEFDLALDWAVIGAFVPVGIAGSLFGRALSARLPRATLQRAFAWFLFAVGAAIAWQNLPRLLS